MKYGSNFFSFTNLCAERLNILNYNTPVHHPQRLLVRPQCQLLSLEPRYPEFLEYIKTESANWPALGHSLLLHHSPFLWHPVWKYQLKVLARGIWKKILILPIFVWCIKWQKDYLEHRRGPANVLMGPSSAVSASCGLMKSLSKVLLFSTSIDTSGI